MLSTMLSGGLRVVPGTTVRPQRLVLAARAAPGKQEAGVSVVPPPAAGLAPAPPALAGQEQQAAQQSQLGEPAAGGLLGADPDAPSQQNGSAAPAAATAGASPAAAAQGWLSPELVGKLCLLVVAALWGSAYELACIWPAAALAAAAGDAGRHGHDALGAGSDATSAAAADVQLGLPPVAPPSLAAPILAPAGSAPAVLQRPAGVLLWPQLRQATTQAAATTNGVDTGAGEAQQPHLQQQLLQLQQQQQWWQLADVPAAPCSSPGVAAGAAAAAAAAVAGDAQQAAAPMQWQGWEQLGPLPACLVTPTAAPAGGGGVDGADPAAPLSAGTVAALMAMFSP